MNTANNQSTQQINTAPFAPREAHQPDAFKPQLPTPMSQVITAAQTLQRFITPQELEVLGNAVRGEEGEFWKAKLVELAELVSSMPCTYQTDGQGDKAIAWLHYFTPSSDFYITERDESNEQHQAFGLAVIWEEELGYISISELLECGVELDLYWTPCTLSQVKAERLMSDTNYTGHPMHY